jgi:hypothetical protein
VAQEADIASRLTGLLRDFVARQLSDGRCLRLDGHLAVSLRNIARTVPLNGIQDYISKYAIYGMKVTPTVFPRCHAS